MPDVRMENASPDDAETIIKIKQSGMPAAYVGYTIYQSPKSAKFMRKMIAEDPKALVRVLKEDGEVVGYNMGTMGVGTAHWLYMAVYPDRKGRGYGTVLLEDFENQARSAGLATITMDCFDDNPNLTWYYRRKWFEAGVSTIGRVMLTPFKKEGLQLALDKTELGQALAVEEDQGFGNVSGGFKDQRVELGLINRDSLRLRSAGDLGHIEVLGAVAGSFSGDRRSIIVSNPDERIAPEDFETKHRALRLERVLD
jgi:GNAT superfamily N-acetyltransferase